jgi:hypothetical protein
MAGRVGERNGAPYYGAAATQCQLFVAMGGSGTRAAGSSAFSRGRITPDCYLNCPDFGKTLQAKQNTSCGLHRDCRLRPLVNSYLPHQTGKHPENQERVHYSPVAPSPGLVPGQAGAQQAGRAQVVLALALGRGPIYWALSGGDSTACPHSPHLPSHSVLEGERIFG